MTSDLTTLAIVVSAITVHLVAVDLGIASKGDFWILLVGAGCLIALLWAYRLYNHESRVRARANHE